VTDWGICATVKATPDQVLAFVAHHLGLGAAQIWLHFDDPDDPAHEAVSGISGVEATRCDEAYWATLIGRRPGKHQNRQSRNMQRVYAQTHLPWVAHIDVDEFLHPTRPIDRVLNDLPPDQSLLRLPPYEALHDPQAPDDIFTSRYFRAALRSGVDAPARARVFGIFAPLLPSGVLSHAAGKCFFRTGLSRFEPRLHGAFRAGARVAGGAFCPDIALLHFHAEDPVRWKDRLPFRLMKGAYQYNPPLQDWLSNARPSEIDQFYAAVQTANDDLLQCLRQETILREVHLHLRYQVATLLKRPAP
jgi:hypothetical protein